MEHLGTFLEAAAASSKPAAAHVAHQITEQGKQRMQNLGVGFAEICLDSDRQPLDSGLAPRPLTSVRPSDCKTGHRLLHTHGPFLSTGGDKSSDAALIFRTTANPVTNGPEPVTAQAIGAGRATTLATLWIGDVPLFSQACKNIKLYKPMFQIVPTMPECPPPQAPTPAASITRHKMAPPPFPQCSARRR